MKKTLSIIIAIVTLIACATNAFAEQKTVLSTTVPGASYTLSIPADQQITFGATTTNIGDVKVTESSNFALGKNLSVTITHDDFSSKDTSTTIPYKIYAQTAGNHDGPEIKSGDSIVFLGKSDGTLNEHVLHFETFYFSRYEVVIDSVDWGKALAGDYSSTITFTAEVVVADDK
ncbi:MAG: hypothetical protein KBS79_05440 [Lachnospiraceae bacterium]|nr:hypothetical protein [Candidatus Minthocola equi]